MSERARQAQLEKIRQRRQRERHEKLFQSKQAEAEQRGEDFPRVEDELEPIVCTFCGSQDCFWFGELVDHVIACPKAQYALPIGASEDCVRSAAKLLAANMVDFANKLKG